MGKEEKMCLEMWGSQEVGVAAEYSSLAVVVARDNSSSLRSGESL